MSAGGARRTASPLLRRILLINLVAPAVLTAGLLGLGAYRDGLVEARLAALADRAETIAGALGEAAVRGGLDPTEIDAAAAAAILARLSDPARERARLFDDGGTVVADTRRFAGAGRHVETADLPPPGAATLRSLFDRAFGAIERLRAGRPERYIEKPDESAADFGEALDALMGERAVARRVLDDGPEMLSAAAPVQRLRKVVGALMLQAVATDVEDAVMAERLSILGAFGLTLAITVAASVLLATWIARPVHRLAEAAEDVRRGVGRRTAIPDFSERGDEIGDLSAALGRMTRALYDRLDAIEAFAADVAHELRNPLTSLRSAVEALSMTRDEAARARLIDVVVADVRRLDHLIADIADASRLDAEMSRERFVPVDLSALARAIAEAEGPRVGVEAAEPVAVEGIELALGRAVRNLVDNAVSFSPPAGRVWIRVMGDADEATLAVEDEGPGIAEDKLEAVFARFYTDRPSGAPGETHSGLGLAIARRIVEAHGGRIRAGTRRDGEGRVLGARFTVGLPAAGRLTGAGGGVV